MDMWNWLMDCLKEDDQMLEALELVMKDDEAAMTLWEDWTRDTRDFIPFVREEVFTVLNHIKKRKEGA